MILHRYLLNEVIRAFGAVIVLLVMIYMSSTFVQYLAQAAAGKIGTDLILSMLGLKLVTALQTMVPLCLYVAVYLALYRLHRDNEVKAITGTGLGPEFFIRSIARLAMGFAVLVAGLGFYLTPWAESQLDELEDRARLESDVTGISAGRFKEFNEGRRILYVERMADDRKTMDNVFLQIREAKRFGVLNAEGAHLEIDPATGFRFIVFTDGRRYAGHPGKLSYEIIEYQKYGVRIESKERIERVRLGKAAPTSGLLVTREPSALAELHWRIALPISAFLLGLMAVALAGLPQEAGRYMGLLSVVLIYFVYSNLLAIGKSLIKKAVVPSLVGLWWVHLLFGVIIVLLFYYPGLLRLMARRRRELEALPQLR